MALTTSSRMEVIVVGELLVGNPSTASVEEPYDDTRVCAMEPLCHRRAMEGRRTMTFCVAKEIETGGS